VGPLQRRAGLAARAAVHGPAVGQIQPYQAAFQVADVQAARSCQPGEPGHPGRRPAEVARQPGRTRPQAAGSQPYDPQLAREQPPAMMSMSFFLPVT
jgi:hypothetical protein